MRKTRLKSKRSTGGLTKEDRDRFQKMKEYGCICCRKTHGRWRYPEIHHILSGGRRIGHHATIPLCLWHHQGKLTEDITVEQAYQAFGPPMAKAKREWELTFGTELELLAEINVLL